MATGKKTGGRNFVKGQAPGRPKGAKDRMPRTFRALAAQVLAAHDGTIQDALLRGIKSKEAHRYLAILASLERQHVDVTAPGLAEMAAALARKVIHECHPGPTKEG